MGSSRLRKRGRQHESFGQPQFNVYSLLGFLPRRSAWGLVMLQIHGKEIARLAQYLLPIFNYQRFLSRDRFFQLLVAFLGVHSRALVFYSDGEIVSRRQTLNIGGFPESEVAHGY